MGWAGMSHNTNAVSDPCGDSGGEMMKYLAAPRYLNYYTSAYYSIHEVKNAPNLLLSSSTLQFSIYRYRHTETYSQKKLVLCVKLSGSLASMWLWGLEWFWGSDAQVLKWNTCPPQVCQPLHISMSFYPQWSMSWGYKSMYSCTGTDISWNRNIALEETSILCVKLEWPVCERERETETIHSHNFNPTDCAANDKVRPLVYRPCFHHLPLALSLSLPLALLFSHSHSFSLFLTLSLFLSPSLSPSLDF